MKEIILSPVTFDIHEDIYRKRHIAADIPSMYGSYREANSMRSGSPSGWSFS